MIGKLLLALAILVFCNGIPFNQTEKTFSQKLDHFNPFLKKHFSQRYWFINQHFNPKNGTVILYICGEYTCPGLPDYRLFPLELAKQFNALILVLEHRFYGASQPFGYGKKSYKRHKLRFLTVEQALEDLAYFINFAKKNKICNISDNTPWITIGGSYPGALSAWFRYKYPHLTIGALGSSAVVKAINPFPEFDEQIYNSSKKSGINCTKTFQNIVKFIDLNPKKVKKMYGIRKLDNTEFAFYIADAIQYGKRKSLCESVSEKSEEEILKIIQQFSNEMGVNYKDYGTYYIRNSTYDINKNIRQFSFQQCFQLGWFQIASKNFSLRSKSLTERFYKKWCRKIFGRKAWPNIDSFNNVFGGKNLNVKNLIMTNGAEDPWQWASVVKEKGDIVSYLIDCENCAHCVELYTPKENDAEVLKETRNKIKNLMAEWIEKHFKNINSKQSKLLNNLKIE